MNQNNKLVNCRHSDFCKDYIFTNEHDVNERAESEDCTSLKQTKYFNSELGDFRIKDVLNSVGTDQLTLNQCWFNVEPQLSSTILNIDIWLRNELKM